MERRTGTRNVNGQPRIESIDPAFAMPGGEVRINGSGLTAIKAQRPTVKFGEFEGAIIVGSQQRTNGNPDTEVAIEPPIRSMALGIVSIRPCRT